MTGKKIAFFDFDGTVTDRDSLPEIIKFYKGKTALYLGFLVNAHWLLAYKLNLLPNDRAKEKILRYFFAGESENVFQKKCDSFAVEMLPGLVRPGALKEIKRLRDCGFEIAVVSASAGNWIRKWAENLSIQLIATRLEIKNGKMTGKIEGKNCYGEQKVNCIKEKWNLMDYSEIFAYGDTRGDRPMLDLATKSFYQPFRKA